MLIQKGWIFSKDPDTKNKDGSKVTSLETLLTLRENIVSTHALFNKLGESELNLFLEKIIAVRV